jgi:hypothetical protein
MQVVTIMQAGETKWEPVRFHTSKMRAFNSTRRG